MSKYFSFRGEVYIAKRDSSGNPLALTDAGNVPTLTLKLSVEKDEHVESRTGQDLVDDVDITKRSGSVTLVAEELIKEVVALALNALTTTVSTGSKTGMAVCTAPEVGKAYLLPDVNVSSVTLAAGGSAVDAGKFSVNDEYGMVTFSDVTGVSGAITASYSTGAATHFALHTDSLPEIWVRLNGVNVKNNAKCVLDLYRVAMDPADTLEWINSKRSNMSLPGAVLADLTKDKDGAMGQFGRYIEIG